GINAGCDASFVMLQAGEVVEAIRLRANRLKVWRKGKLLAESPVGGTALYLGARSGTTAFERGNG
ncbi:MAG: cytosine deaminase, partial [Ramlibacter sp.]